MVVVIFGGVLVVVVHCVVENISVLVAVDVVYREVNDMIEVMIVEYFTVVSVIVVPVIVAILVVIVPV